MTARRPVTAGAPEQHGTGRFPCMDGYRALAALAVVVFHVAHDTGATTSTSAGWALARLDVGVHVFFLLSGFLLYRPFVAAAVDQSPPPRLATYLARRGLRILPAYWLVVVVLVAVGRIAVNNLQDVVFWGGLLVVYDGIYLFSPALSQAWTLAVELSFYAFLPLWAVAVARGRGSPRARLRTHAIAVGALYAAGVAARAAALADDPSGLALVWLPTHLDLFALGMGMAVASVAASTTGSEPRLAAWAGRHPGWCWAGAAVAFWVVSTQVGLPRIRAVDPVTLGPSLARHLLFGVIALLLLLPGVFGPQDHGLVRRLLRSRPAHAVGTISYGIYLWHFDVLREVAFEPGDLARFGPPRFLTVLAVVLAITVALATATHVAVERPARRLGRRLDRPRAGRDDAGAPGPAELPRPAPAVSGG